MTEGEANVDVRYVVVGTKPWNRRVFDEQLTKLPGNWSYVDTARGVAELPETQPRYAFFLHWSHMVPREVFEACECVLFHMTDVPYGRGGSPLQNLILRGHANTMLTALRMTAELDAGPVYLKRPMDLDGTAEAIYARSSLLAAEMIREIVASEPEPEPQVGEVVVFARRRPHESAIENVATFTAMHDFIRMLDADGYPHAYIDHSGFRFSIVGSCRYDDRIEARVTITRVPDDVSANDR